MSFTILVDVHTAALKTVEEKHVQISGQAHELARVQNWCGVDRVPDADKAPTVPIFAKSYLNHIGVFFFSFYTFK